MEYLMQVSRSGKSPTFEALVTDVRRMGVFVEIMEMQVKGLVKKEDFPEGRWQLDTSGMRYGLRGTQVELKLGQRVKVKIRRVDMERQLVDFLIEEV